MGRGAEQKNSPKIVGKYRRRYVLSRKKNTEEMGPKKNERGTSVRRKNTETRNLQGPSTGKKKEKKSKNDAKALCH